MRALLRELFETVVLALFIFLALHMSVQNFLVQGPSMRPTLDEGEYVLVNKLVYMRFGPDSLARLLPFLEFEDGEAVFPFHPPRRGEVIIFRFPQGPREGLRKEGSRGARRYGRDQGWPPLRQRSTPGRAVHSRFGRKEHGASDGPRRHVLRDGRQPAGQSGLSRLGPRAGRQHHWEGVGQLLASQSLARPFDFSMSRVALCRVLPDCICR